MVAAVAIPVVSVVLVLVGWSRGNGVDDPVGPGAIAVVTLLGGAVLAWRAATQHARLDDEALWCRNLTVSFAVEWERIEALHVVRRAPVMFIEIRVADLRRSHRLGAATRFSSDDAGVDEVLAALRSHPKAGSLLEEVET